MAVLLPTTGELDRCQDLCIVSWPASMGADSWDTLVKGAKEPVNYACVWTGNNDSPLKDWFVPWVENVKEALRRGMTLHVVGHGDHPASRDNPQFKEFSQLDDIWIGKSVPKGGVQRVIDRETNYFRLGHGQKIEVEFLNSRNIKYKVHVDYSYHADLGAFGYRSKENGGTGRGSSKPLNVKYSEQLATLEATLLKEGIQLPL